MAQITYEIIVSVGRRTPVLYTFRASDDARLRTYLRDLRNRHGRTARIDCYPVRGFHPVDPAPIPYTAR